MNYHNTLDAVVFDQTAAEDYALYVQTFALARLRLEEQIKRRKAAGENPQSLFVISDLDETLLDNSAYNAWLIETGRDFHDDTWKAWCRAGQAKATPGAVEFVKFAVAQGVKVFYVSSRFEENREDTARNLSAHKFPLPDASADPAKTHLFLARMVLAPNGPQTKKKEQFAHLRARMGNAPLLQLGDNLSDHEPDRYSKDTRYDARAANAKNDKLRWGDDWIAFPNSVYGAWRQSLRWKDGTGNEHIVADENPPAPFQVAPVREPVTPGDSLKIKILNRWNGQVPR